MSTARDTVVEALAAVAALEPFDVVPYSRSKTIATRTVMVRVDTVRPAGPQRQYDLSLIVAVPETDPTGPADDALDAALELVLDVLDTGVEAVAIRFNQATRATLDEAYPAYRVEVTIAAQKGTQP